MRDIKGSPYSPEVISLFFKLIRCGIGKESMLPLAPTVGQWEQLYDLACRHTLQGIAFAGIERLPKEQRPPSSLILKWYQTVLVIKNTNKEMTAKASKVIAQFRKDGFRSLVLKGQGIAQYYPQPHLRVSGDIDLWIEGGCDRVISYVSRIIPRCSPVYHHVDFPVLPDTGIELHYRPTWMYNPFHKSRLQRYFLGRGKHEFVNAVETAEGTLYAPTVQFNLVYIPIHIYRHLFDEGIGMRQILDYYYVLHQEVTPDEKRHSLKMLESIGLSRFMRALMYVLQQMFALDDEHMLVPPDSKHGKFLLDEIMLSGNFGRGDTRYACSERGFNHKHFNNQFKRSLMLVKYYPSETMWNPFFKVWHYFWRKRHRKLKTESSE